MSHQLVGGSSQPRIEEWGQVVFQFGVRRHDRENLLVGLIQELDSMRKRTILAILIDAQEPDNSGKQNSRTLYKKIPLLCRPTPVKVKHDRIRTFVSVGYISHKFRIQRVTSVAAAGIVEVNHVELGNNLIPFLMGKQMVVGNRG